MQACNGDGWEHCFNILRMSPLHALPWSAKSGWLDSLASGLNLVFQGRGKQIARYLWLHSLSPHIVFPFSSGETSASLKNKQPAMSK